MIHTVVVSDLDLSSWEPARETGSVRLLHARRPDVYSLEAKAPIELIRTE